MKTHWQKISLIVFVLFILTHATLQAQITIEPLYYLAPDAQLYRWTGNEVTPVLVGPPIPEGAYGFNVSPLGDKATFMREADIVTQMREAEGGIGGGELPNDIWMIDLITGIQWVIGAQPPGLTVETAHLGITHSPPVWSPDGTQLAWTEGVEGGNLMIYDVASQSLTKLAEGLPSHEMIPASTKITSWTASGILIENRKIDSELLAMVNDGFLFLGTDATVRLLPAPRPGEIVSDMVILRDGSSELLLVKYQGDKVALNPQTGEQVEINGVVFMESAPGTSLLVAPAVMDENGRFNYDIYAPDQQLLRTVEDGAPIFSPSGQAVIFDRSYSGVDVSGSLVVVNFPVPPQAVIWGRTAYRLVRTGSTTLIDGPHCAGSVLPFRLRVNQEAYVITDSANNVRSEPSTDSVLVGTIPGNDWFEVTDGPVCSGGLAWWEIDGDGVTGWTAEGSEDEYWLKPGCPESGCGRG